ncbi:MAG TPA: helix-turn-helix transcriptional regulator [Candidatus Rifleibacterium sp.]|nr:helix-turn-helix transcriptional regulator [Candidatus Rifleibacterium sp.]
MSARMKAMKKWLIDKEITQAEIARQLGISQTAVYNVMSGKMKSRRVVKLLLELGCPPEILEQRVA